MAESSLTCADMCVPIICELGQAKVAHLGLELLIQQNVARLHIAVDDLGVDALTKKTWLMVNKVLLRWRLKATQIRFAASNHLLESEGRSTKRIKPTSPFPSLVRPKACVSTG
jgi:uncharacterized membrane protein